MTCNIRNILISIVMPWLLAAPVYLAAQAPSDEELKALEQQIEKKEAEQAEAKKKAEAEAKKKAEAERKQKEEEAAQQRATEEQKKQEEEAAKQAAEEEKKNQEYMGKQTSEEVQKEIDVINKSVPYKGGGWTGLLLMDVTQDKIDSTGMNQLHGALVYATTPNSPAADAGIQKGDVVIAVNSKKIDSAAELQHLIVNAHVGEHLLLTISRKGEQINLQVEVDETPENKIHDILNEWKNTYQK